MTINGSGLQLVYNSNHNTPPIFVVGESKRKRTPSTTSSASINDEKPHACPRCPLSFSRAHNLRSHLTTHTDNRPHQCETCAAQFRRQHDLKRHEKLHSGERPYVCDVCARSFSRLDALHRHQRVDGAIRCSMANRHSIVPFPVPTIPQVSSPPETVSPNLVSPGTFLSNSLPPSPPAEPFPPRLDPYPSLFQQRILPPPPSFPVESSSTQQLKREHKLQVDRLTRQVHDLQVENNLLRSLVLGAKTYSSADVGVLK